MRRLVLEPLGLSDCGFTVADGVRLVAPYQDGSPEPTRMGDGALVPFQNYLIRFAPSRALDPASYPSGGGGMVGTAHDVLRFLEAIRAGGAPILDRATVAGMTADHVGPQAETQGPGWGFGYGWAVLVDPAAAATPQSKGTFQWGGAYGHKWFVDPAQALTVVVLTNTAFEGMAGAFVAEVRDAVYG
jgi:CubicO group peptidase (beta-lactamase class C family)